MIPQDDREDNTWNPNADDWNQSSSDGFNLQPADPSEYPLPPSVPDDAQEEGDTDYPDLSLEEALVKIVTRDFKDAQEFMRGIHEEGLKNFKLYHNSRNYKSIKESKEFPAPFMQRDVDMFVADCRDKLFYNGKPATVVGGPGADPGDVKAKEEFLKWQDKKDKIHKKFGTWLRDVALFKYCVSQVDYKNTSTLKWVEEAYPVVDAYGNAIYDPETKKPQIEKRWELKKVPDFRGAHCKRIDPLDVFWTQEKREVEDGWPLMIRSYQPISYYYSKGYFFNQKDINKVPAKTISSMDDNSAAKRMFLHTGGSGTSQTVTTRKTHENIEWHGTINKLRLYKYILKNYDRYESSYPGLNVDILETIRPNEQCWAIVDVVDGRTVVRIDETPFRLERPNVVIGIMESEEDELHGACLADKIYACAMGMQELVSRLFDNFEQTVNAMWVIKANAITDKKPLVNEPGYILTTDEDPNNVVRRVEQQRIAPDIYNVLEMMKEWRGDAGAMRDIVTGMGDPAANTLGTANILMTQAMLRIRDYLRSFEESFVQPLYEMRNFINMTFIDEDFAYEVIGDEKGGAGNFAWKTATPNQIRAEINFVCESSVRETNRAVIVQQMIQLMNIAPMSLQLGQPCRLDKIGAKMMEQGYSYGREQVEDVFPMIKVERQKGVDFSEMLVNNALLTAQAMGMQIQSSMAQMFAQQIMGQTGQAGQNNTDQTGKVRRASSQTPNESTTESDVISSAQQTNNAHIRGVS